MLAIFRGFIALFAISTLLFAGIFVLSIAVLRGGFRAMTFQSRFSQMLRKYGNDNIARMIAKGEIWTGQTAEELTDAKGKPLAVYSEGSAEVWSFKPEGFTRLPMQVVLEQGRVVRWQLAAPQKQ